MRIVVKNSPNQSERIHGQEGVRLIIAHTPEGGYEGTVNFIMRSSSDVSYHMLIAQDGSEATQLVPWSRKAWHAGVFNSMSDGISIAGHARHFDLDDWKGVDEFAAVIAQRLIARGLRPNWTTNSVTGGFCRHGDIQSNRTDPTPDLTEWRLFVAMVKAKYNQLTMSRDWPIPVPDWFWVWARWKLGVREFKVFGPGRGPRPGAPVPKPGPLWATRYAWAWRRLRALQNEQLV